MDFSHHRERKASNYGFIPDIIAYLGSDIPSEISNLKNEFLGSGDATDHPKDYSPPIDLSAAMMPTPLEQKWDLQSPDGLEEREMSSDEDELQSFFVQSKYISLFPLYQDYFLQAARDKIQKNDNVFLFDQGLTESFQSVFSSFQHRKNLDVSSPYVTPESISPPPTFHGRRSAIRRHAFNGVSSPRKSPNSSPTRPFVEQAFALSPVKPRGSSVATSSDECSPAQLPNIALSSCTLWQDLEEVKASDLLKILTPKQIILQESMFELVASEGSYLKSLGVVINHFYASNELKKTISKMEHRTLFCNIRHVMQANMRFFLDLEARLGESVMIFQVGDIVLLHCGNFQRQYVPYLTNMNFQESLVNQLLRENKEFVCALKRLEDDPVCQKRRLKSFLVLPFQRITRIKLLLEGILKLTEPNSEAASNLTKAIKGIHEILVECDQKVEKMKSLEELVRLEMLLDFADIKSVPLVKSTRVLVHHGPLATLGSYGSKMSINRIYLHLFNDLLLISSKKYQRFTVLDYALFPQHVNVVQSKVVGLPPESFLLMLSESQMGPLTTMILIADGSFDKEEWIKALSKK